MSQHWPTPPIPAPEPPAVDRVVAAGDPVAATPEPFVSPVPQRDERPWWRRSLSLLLVIGLLILKWGKAALLLLPKAKVLTTSATMLVSIAAYSLMFAAVMSRDGGTNNFCRAGSRCATRVITSLAIGAAVFDPPPPCSTMTEIA